MTIIYKPTWLYIKQHNQTGLKYIGITTRDPFRYKGSGIRWCNHLRKHGNDVSTLWCQLYTDRNELIEEATSFSRSHCIVESECWANLMPETGIPGGGIKGRVMSDETKEKLRKANTGHIHSEETKIKLQGPKTDEAKLKMRRSSARRGKPGTFNGKHHTVEVKKKIGDRYYPTGEEHRESKAVVINDKNYPSITTASKSLSVPASTLADLLKGRAKSSKKYPWIKSITYFE